MTYIISSQGVVQLGRPDLWYNGGGSVKVGAHKLFLFTESFLEVKINST